jgi:hypothetical protein
MLTSGEVAVEDFRDASRAWVTYMAKRFKFDRVPSDVWLAARKAFVVEFLTCRAMRRHGLTQL